MNEEQKRVMTPEDFAERMRDERNSDPESGHIHADKLMCNLLSALGYGEGVEVFDSLDKWYA